MDQLENKLYVRLLISVFFLIIFGLLMVYSSSYIYAKEVYGDSLHFIVRQSWAFVLGIIAFAITANIKFEFWYKQSQYLLLFTCLLLMLTLVPGFGAQIKGSARWLSLGFLSFQPSEIEKFIIIIASINFFHRFEFLDSKERFWNALILLIPLGLNLIQPDYGTFSICLAIILFCAFMSPFSRPFFYSIVFAGVLGGLVALVMAPYRVRRLLVFLDPWSDPKGHGFQIIQSYLGFANGRIWGQGIGNSNEKLFYLPEAHNDFILSVIGEEFGFVGIFILSTLFLYFLITGLRLAFHLKDPRHSLAVAASVFSIALQAFLNMGVVLGLLPTKGLNLPFISFGGTSLVSNLICLGILTSAFKADFKLFSSGKKSKNFDEDLEMDSLKRPKRSSRVSV